MKISTKEKGEESPEEHNPLRATWSILSVPLSLIGLASLSDSLIAWKGFVANSITVFRSLTHPVYDWALSWLPFSVSTDFYDYITLGALFAGCVFRGSYLLRVFDREIAEGNPSLELERKDLGLISHVVIFLLWPIFLVLMVFNFVFIKEVRKEIQPTFQWIGAIALGFVILASLNLAIF